MSKGVKPTRYFLDTSIFVQIIKLDVKLRQLVLTKLTTPGKTAASYLTLIEINKYFLVVAIEMYELIKEHKDVSSAVMKLSNSYGRRANYFMIIMALVDRNIVNTGSMPGYRTYISQLETVIVTLQDEVYYMVSEFHGVYKKHPIVLSRVFSADDFDLHTKVVAANKVLDYSETWNKYQAELLNADEYFKTESKLTRKLQREIHELVQAVLEDPDVKQSARKLKGSKHFGDMAISLNAPKNVNILAHDHSFEVINEALGKESTYVTEIDKATL